MAAIFNSPIVNAAQTEPLALYIHWPFCVSKCPYCDFNSHVREGIDIAAWKQALIADMAHEAQLTKGRPLTSIFFGGGTPSLMPPALAASLIDAAGRFWCFSHDIEITLEANPSSVEAARFADLAQAGVNRVSLGLQALDNKALRFLGRAHDADEGLAALTTAQSVFGRVNFDLIYARPGQGDEQWRTELASAIGLGASHMSLYQLTIEPRTRFETLVRQGRFAPIDPDFGATLFETTQEMMDAAGLPAYEISNHAAPGQESRHNLTYWRYGDYVGVGPGAHGRRNGVATVRHKKPENFLSAAERNGHGLQSETPLGGRERASEALMMGLRLREGVNLRRVARVSALGCSDLVNLDAAEHLSSIGLIRLAGEHLSVLPAGMLLLDAILPELLLV